MSRHGTREARGKITEGGDHRRRSCEMVQIFVKAEVGKIVTLDVTLSDKGRMSRGGFRTPCVGALTTCREL